MKRETRVNLWFLILFVAISLPGAVILFRKKLDPLAPRLDQPDPVLSQLPYMAPLPAPPGIRWMVPSRTRNWLGEVTHDRTGVSGMFSATPPGPDWEPVISHDHLLQIVALSREPSQTTMGLVIWDAGLTPEAGLFSTELQVKGADKKTGGRILAAEEVAVPQEVRHELVSLDFVRPPMRVTFVRVEFPQSLPMDSTARLTLSYSGTPAALHTTVDFVVR